jgi:hypothetical protein
LHYSHRLLHFSCSVNSMDIGNVGVTGSAVKSSTGKMTVNGAGYG